MNEQNPSSISEHPWWAKIIRKKGSSRLYVKLFYHGRYVEKTTKLRDNDDNRRVLQIAVDAVNQDLAADSLIFEDAFPGASEADKRFFAEKAGRVYIAPPGAVTFEQAYRVWAKVEIPQISSRNTRTDYRKALEPHILPFFRDKTFDQITEGVVRDFFLKRFKNGDPAQGLLSAKRMKNILVPLSKIWEFTVKERKWNLDSPFMGIYDFIARITAKKPITLTVDSVKDQALQADLKKHESEVLPRNRRVLLFSDYIKILGHLDPFFRPAAEVAVLTGLIASEIAGIHKESRQNGILHIAWSVRGKQIQKSLKTSYRTRDIPLTNAINRVMDASIQQNVEDAIFVFLRKRGALFREREFREAWCVACEKAKIERTVPYALRHCFVAYSELAGVSKQRLVGLMGHADKAMIDRVYGKYVNFLEKDRQAIKDYFGEDFWGE
jgi:integrase